MYWWLIYIYFVLLLPRDYQSAKRQVNDNPRKKDESWKPLETMSACSFFQMRWFTNQPLSYFSFLFPIAILCQSSKSTPRNLRNQRLLLPVAIGVLKFTITSCIFCDFLSSGSAKISQLPSHSWFLADGVGRKRKFVNSSSF